MATTDSSRESKAKTCTELHLKIWPASRYILDEVDVYTNFIS